MTVKVRDNKTGKTITMPKAMYMMQEAGHPEWQLIDEDIRQQLKPLRPIDKVQEVINKNKEHVCCGGETPVWLQNVPEQVMNILKEQFNANTLEPFYECVLKCYEPELVPEADTKVEKRISQMNKAELTAKVMEVCPDKFTKDLTRKELINLL